MITEQDLQEAIAECQGQRNPNASTCIKLAAFYTIKEHLFPSSTETVKESGYSYDAPSTSRIIEYDGTTEFSDSINGKDIHDVVAIIDEAMTALSVMNPRLYASIIRKLNVSTLP